MFISHQRILPQGVLAQGVMSLNAKWLVYSKRKKKQKFDNPLQQNLVTEADMNLANATESSVDYFSVFLASSYVT